MKKALIVSVIAGISILGLSTSVANAWHYGISGSGVCQPDGSYKITWTLDNTSEPTALEIKESNRAVVKAGDSVAPGKAKNFSETVDGTKPGSYILTLRGDWDGDRSNQKQSKTVKLKQACAQPKVPETPVTTEEPGRGAGQVLAETSPPQVTIAPVGAVNAGEGNDTNYLVAISGLVLSTLAIAYGIVTLVKSRG